MAAAAPNDGSGRRVAVVLHEGVLGGASLSVVRLVPLLEERGWRFRFWAPRPSPLFDELRERDLDVDGAFRPIVYSLEALALPPGRGARLRAVPGYLRAFRRWLRAERTDILHANSLFTLAEALIGARQGIPVAFHVHEMLRPGRKGRAARALAHRLPGVVIGVSGACAARLSLPGRPARVVYESAPIPAEAPRRKPVSGRTVVGTVGVVSTRKGSDLFVEAARLVGEREQGVEFQMIGAATDELEIGWAEEVLARARAAGVAHEPRTDVAARLREWDVFALPSRHDPFPIALLEAMGAALPVVGAAVDGIREQVTAETGILVPPEDPARLASAIVELHRDPERRLRLGAAGRARALERFTLEHQADGLERAYREALERASR